MRIHHLSNSDVTTAPREMSLLAAAKLMRERHVGDVVVIEQRGAAQLPVGIVTDRDIVLGAIAQGIDDLAKVHVGDLAPSPCHVIGRDDRIENAIDIMQLHGVRRLPVVNDRGELEGIVTYDDVVSWMLSTLSSLSRSFTKQRRREEIRRP
ncbi:MAG: CBS domain-containing protein [Deltaproteobacteria bacterium]|jgi:CBS domain-containing protein